MHAHEDILERRHVREETDVLERSSDAERNDLVWAGAAEHSETGEQMHVPDRPDDRDQQQGDQADERGQDQELANRGS